MRDRRFKTLFKNKLIIFRNEAYLTAAGAAERRGLAEKRGEKEAIFFSFPLCETSAFCCACGGEFGLDP